MFRFITPPDTQHEGFKYFHADIYSKCIAEILKPASDKDHYPVILYPETLRNQIDKHFTSDCPGSGNRFKSIMHYQDFLDAARELDIKGDDWVYPTVAISKPLEPKEPRMHEIPTKVKEYYKKVEWKFFALDLIYSIIKGFLFTFPVALINKDEFVFDFVKAIVGFTFVFIVSSFCFFLYEKNKRPFISTDIRLRKMTPQKIEKSKETTERQYRKDMEEYEIRKKRYEKELIEYEEEKKRVEIRRRNQASLLEEHEKEITYHILKGSIPNEIIDMNEIPNPPQRGASENRLFLALMKKISSCVKVDRSFHGYFPDLVIYDKYGCPCPIDIEIDEPYEYKTRKEIHYIGCGDEKRNEVFVANGWFVLRFSERQIMDNLNECVDIVIALVYFIMTGDPFRLCKYEIKDNSIKMMPAIKKIREPRWTKEMARVMSLENSRGEQPS